MHRNQSPILQTMWPIAGLFASTFAGLAAGCGEDTEAKPTTSVTAPLTIEANVAIDEFIEIDDLDATAGGNRDANLCSSSIGSANGSPACPAIACSGAFCPYSTGDNPNFPGPDNALPGTLGADDEEYIDWADLGYLYPTKTFFFSDPLDGGEKDDIFSPGSCITRGNSPSKANATTIGVAANDVYLWLDMVRDTVQGQEEYHFFFTKAEAHTDSGNTEGCAEPTLLWDVEDGDVQVVVRLPSTSHLADGTIEVLAYDDDATPDPNLSAEELILSPKWKPVADAAYVVFDVSISRGDATPDIDTDGAGADEDRERYLDGAVLATTQMAEAAVDIEKVFGNVGCGLTRSMAVITTASGSPGDTDDLKDFLGLITITTGDLVPEISLDPSCTEDFAYAVSLEDDAGNTIPLDGSLVDVEIVYDCGSGETTVQDAGDDGVGSIAVPIASKSGSVSCSAKAHVIGKTGTDFESCDKLSEAATQNVWADLVATADLDSPLCDGNVSFGVTVQGGKGLAPTYDWTFTPTPAATLTPALVAPEPASGTLAVSGTFAPVSVKGEVTVTEQREEIQCSDTDDDTAVVYQPLAVSLSMDSSDLMCPVAPASALALLYGDVAVDVAVQGGSGNWSLDFALAGDTDVYGGNISGVLACSDAASLVDADASYANTCAFSLSDGKACALGQISLGVTDVGNAACTFPAQGPLQAEKTTELDVAPLAP